MRCLSCNNPLNDLEATRRYTESQEFIDLCNKCFGYIKEDIDYSERDDLSEIVEEDSNGLDILTP